MALRYFEFDCASCGRFESLESEHHDFLPCPSCGGTSWWVISAPKIKPSYASAATSTRSNERPPGALDTRSLAEGESPSEWSRRTREKIRKERRDKFRKEVL